jgi:hypothetical protein
MRRLHVLVVGLLLGPESHALASAQATPQFVIAADFEIEVPKTGGTIHAETIRTAAVGEFVQLYPNWCRLTFGHKAVGWTRWLEFRVKERAVSSWLVEYVESGDRTARSAARRSRHRLLRDRDKLIVRAVLSENGNDFRATCAIRIRLIPSESTRSGDAR